jgi:DNA-binding NtrC family response regulator
MVHHLDAVSIAQMPLVNVLDENPDGSALINRNGNKGLLVLIEPDASVREALRLLLEGEDWIVLEARDCRELERRIEEASGEGGLAAVISESSLPGCTPEEILEMGKRHGIPVAFTGHDLPLQGAVDLIRQGAADFLDKPFPQGRLLDLLERLAKRQNGKSAGPSKT